MSMRFHIIGYTLGILLTITGFAQLIPALVDMLAAHVNGNVFFFSALTSLFFGFGMIFAFRSTKPVLNLREMFLLTALSWLSLCVFGAIPLYISDLDMHFVDAFFEATSGITTTGATVISDLDNVSRGILIWRSILQWVGGVGILAYVILLLPLLRIGGMQIFQSEAYTQSDKIMPRSRSVIFSIVVIYIGMTVLCGYLYRLFGMSAFDAVNHAMTTVSTGGFSTHDASFGYFESLPLQYVAMIFMILSALPFVLYIKFIFQGRSSFLKDEQFVTFIGLLLAITLGLGVWLCHSSANSLLQSVHKTSFHVVSILTTTGYRAEDYTLWGAFATMAFFFITYLGGCAGSAAGGLKTIRSVVAFKGMLRQLKNLLYPRAVFSMIYQGRQVPHHVILSVFGFLGIYVALNVFLAIALSFAGLDFVSSVSAAGTAIANVGPGVGEVIGPGGTYESISGRAKYLLCVGMLVGRLEILTAFVLLMKQYWRS